MAPSLSLYDRDLVSDVGNAKNTFSSWDGCMAKTYCKYPVIVAIIIFSLIVLSIVFCFVRCCCMGLECCCGVCSCCNACCPSPRKRDKPSKFSDGPGHYNNVGYQSHAPPQYGNTPQFATFESSNKKSGGAGNVHADSLPAMPSWDTAKTTRVEDTNHHESHEMDHMTPQDEQKAPMLNHPGAGGGDAFAAGSAAPSPYSDHGYGQHNPMDRYSAAAAMPAVRPTRSPAAAGGYQSPTAYGAHDAYGQQAAHDPYGQQGSHNQGYDHGYDHGYDQGYGQTAYGVTSAAAVGHQSPPSHSPAPVPARQGYGNNSPAAALPSALQSGGAQQPASPGGYAGYGNAYAQSKPQYQAYAPSDNSTRYEPSSYGGGGGGMRRPGQGNGYHDL